MAVKLRLRRGGAKKQPTYRIVAADSRAPRDGRFIEIIGAYNPLTDPPTISLDRERAVHWLRAGAQPTEVVKKMLVAKGVWAIFTGEAIPEPIVPVVPPEEIPPVASEVPGVPVEAILPVEEPSPAEAPEVSVDETSPAVEAPAEPFEEEAPA